jgi:hypothetical protein
MPAVKLARRYGFDGILVVLTGQPPNYLDNVTSIRAEADGEWLTWRNGDRTFMPGTICRITTLRTPQNPPGELRDLRR